MRQRATVLLLVALALASTGFAASLEKAKTLRQNGLLDDAKKELVELAFAADSNNDVRAEALVMLGDIAVDEKKYDTARENWNKAITAYPASSASALAKDKLRMLDQLRPSS